MITPWVRASGVVVDGGARPPPGEAWIISLELGQWTVDLMYVLTMKNSRLKLGAGSLVCAGYGGLREPLWRSIGTSKERQDRMKMEKKLWNLERVNKRYAARDQFVCDIISHYLPVTMLDNEFFSVPASIPLLVAPGLRPFPRGGLEASECQKCGAMMLRVSLEFETPRIGAFKRCSMPDNVNVTLAPAHQGQIKRELSLLNFFKGAFEGGTGLETGISESESCERSILGSNGNSDSALKLATYAGSSRRSRTGWDDTLPCRGEISLRTHSHDDRVLAFCWLATYLRFKTSMIFQTSLVRIIQRFD
ncbi:hypothetical protein F5880DRAFT_1511222 [Lentinula raphanica]|nr:hypothetical protein F5880DRAFT_1511222 [Lentinula raphanica]